MLHMELVASNIEKSFGNNMVLADVSLELSAGKISVLMGTNGAGKTTLLNILSGFMKPDSGSIYLNGRELSGLPPHEIALRGIRRTFQDMRLIEDMSVLENVLLAFPGQQGEKWWKTLIPSSRIEAEQQTHVQLAESLLESCFLTDVIDHKASDVSYGQQKLLNLACCLASGAPVLLLDEPVAGVNAHYRDQLSTVIKQQKQEGKSLLIIEHNSDFIEAVADEILFLNKGLLRQFPSYASFRNDDSVKNAYV